jgi:hypothetical protein
MQEVPKYSWLQYRNPKMKDRMKLSLTKFGTKKGLAKEGTKK